MAIKETLQGWDTAHVAGAMVLGALLLLGALRTGFGGIAVRIGD